MHRIHLPIAILIAAVPCASALAQDTTARAATAPPDPIAQLVARLDLERYKATIKGLTQFGDRRQGTARNRAAVDWIEQQLRSYGCSDVSRLTYDFQVPPPRAPGDSVPRPARDTSRGAGGSRYRGIRARTGVNNDSLRQPDAALRKLNAEPSTSGERQEVYCTKVGATHPEEMYIIGGHMDGIGWGEAANDDGSGTAIVLELARIFSSADVRTERSIRFALWNNEETGLNGARAYVAQRQAAAGQGGSCRLGPLSRAQMARHDSARHDAVRSRHAARRRQFESRAAARSRREHRIPGEREIRR